MKKLVTKIAGVLLLVGMTCSISSASPVLCPDGANYAAYMALSGAGNGCFIGDKLFNGFGYSNTTLGPNVLNVPATAITVTTIGPAGTGATLIGSEFGFLFSAPWFAGPNSSHDSILVYNVTTRSGAPLIFDNTLLMVGGFTGTGVARVDEIKCLGASFAPCPGGIRDLHVFNSAMGAEFQDHIEFFPNGTGVTTVGVIKDIFLSGGSNGTAAISGVQNTFSQIPEPASLLLIGSGLLGVFALRRKRKAI